MIQHIWHHCLTLRPHPLKMCSEKKSQKVILKLHFTCFSSKCLEHYRSFSLSKLSSAFFRTFCYIPCSFMTRKNWAKEENRIRFPGKTFPVNSCQFSFNVSVWKCNVRCWDNRSIDHFSALNISWKYPARSLPNSLVNCPRNVTHDNNWKNANRIHVFFNFRFFFFSNFKERKI